MVPLIHFIEANGRIDVLTVLKGTDVYSEAEVFVKLDMKVYYRNSNNDIFTADIKPDETMREVAAKIQDKGGLNPCHVSVTMVNNACDCGKLI